MASDGFLSIHQGQLQAHFLTDRANLHITGLVDSNMTVSRQAKISLKGRDGDTVGMRCKWLDGGATLQAYSHLDSWTSLPAGSELDRPGSMGSAQKPAWTP